MHTRRGNNVRRVGWLALAATLATRALCTWKSDAAAPLLREQAPIPVSRRPITFGAYPVVIDYQTDGCFHSRHYRLRYEPLPTPRLSVAEDDYYVVDKHNPKFAINKGPVHLEPVMNLRLCF